VTIYNHKRLIYTVGGYSWKVYI